MAVGVMLETYGQSELQDDNVDVALSFGQVAEVASWGGQGWGGEQSASGEGRELHVRCCNE